MESQPQNPEFRSYPENFHPCKFSCFCCCLLTFFKISFLEKFFQKHYQSVKQFGSISVLSGPDLGPNWS